jgi:hypothetical protein
VKYIKISSWSWWKFMWKSREYCGLFRNLSHIRPGRWGFFILGFEVGSRNPDDPVGVFLKRWGLWPW